MRLGPTIINLQSPPFPKLNHRQFMDITAASAKAWTSEYSIYFTVWKILACTKKICGKNANQHPNVSEQLCPIQRHSFYSLEADFSQGPKDHP